MAGREARRRDAAASRTGMTTLLKLRELGQSCWLDNLSRPMLDSGELARRVDEGLRGVTANPSTFEKAIVGADAYAAQIRELALAGRPAAQIYESLVTTDVQRACDLLRGVFDASGGKDGFVSLEVSPHLARHAAASIDEAHRLAALVERPNLMIKIPGTEEGLAAIEQLLFDGLNINITLLFAVPRYEAVAASYMTALERRVQAGRPVDGVASVASFFLSRIDVLVDRLLVHRQPEGAAPAYDVDPATLHGTIAVANAKLAYRSLLRLLESARWRRLEAAGARVQRLLWASTGTKNPDDDPLKYVEPLIGPHTVNTMPERTLAAWAESGRPRSTVTTGARLAGRALRDLGKVGIDLRRVTARLEDEGIEKFVQPYDKLLAAIESRRARCVGAGQADDAVAELARVAHALRCDVIEMTSAAGSGHPTSCMSAADIVAALFFRVMRWDPGRPQARNVDRFILSKGHAAPLLWAALARAGAIDEDPLRLRQIDATLEGHPTPRNAWVDVATGSLGQGLAAANGMAIANRLDSVEARVYCLLGDGECSEGSVWEAAQFAALQQLRNVIAIVDQNGYGQSGPTPWRHDSAVLAQRFAAFGWRTFEIDGHDLARILAALQMADEDGPSAIIARTVKGQGVSFLAGRDGWHGKALDDDERRAALEELGRPRAVPRVQARTVGRAQVDAQQRDEAIEVSYRRDELVATRDAYGAALCKLGELNRSIVAVDGDVMDSTRAEAFGRAFPSRFFQGYIAEQNMVGVAVGLAAMGKIPFVATFACFLTRAADFIRMAGHSRPRHLVFCGSHAGISIGEDGPSQMGLEDLALFRAIHGSTVLYPSDAVSAERLTELAARTEGLVYLRMARPKTPVIYDAAEQFAVGGSKVLRASHDDAATIVAAGITVHEALAAHAALARRGVQVRVIDAYSVKPLDTATLRKAAGETGRLLVVEDHWIDGGLGDAVAAALAGAAEVQRLAIRDEPRSGPREQLLDRYGISRRAIERTFDALVEA